MTSPTLVRSGAVLWGNLIVVYLVWGSTYLAIKFATESVAPLLAIGTRFLEIGRAHV